MPNIQKLFTDISPTYDKANHWMSLGLDVRWRKRAIDDLSLGETAQNETAQNETPLVALDLCAGTLDLSLALLNRYPNAHIEALDFSLGMLKVGEQKLSQDQQAAIKLTCADALAMPFKDNQFDLVICAYGIRNIPNQTQALTEIHRVLKPGGTYGILEFFKPTRLFSKIFYHTMGRYGIPLIGGWISKNRDAYLYLNQSIHDYQSRASYEDMMRKNKITPYFHRDFMGGISSLILGRKEVPAP